MTIGDQAYQNAVNRLKMLEKEVIQLREFLALCERYAHLSGRAAPDSTGEHLMHSEAVEPENPNRLEPATRGETATPQKIREIAREAMILFDKPLTRGDLVSIIEGSHYTLNAKDKANHVGTVMWRAKDQFVNFPSSGYWPIDLPYAPEGYEGTVTKKENNTNDGKQEKLQISYLEDENLPK